MNGSEPTRLKVGDVARATGLTVRTLHHYDDLGLLRPSGRTAAGHRYYLPKDMDRLQRIVSLRQLGLSLQQIGDSLDRPEHSMLPVLERHLQALDAHIDDQRRLRDRIAWLRDRLRRDDDVSVQDLLQTIEETIMFEKHFDKDQLEWLERRRQQVGDDRIREVEREWPRLIADVRAEMQRGAEPDDPDVLALARRWRALVEEFTAGREDIARGVASVNANEPAARRRTGLDAAVMSFIGRAMQHLGGGGTPR